VWILLSVCRSHAEVLSAIQVYRFCEMFQGIMNDLVFGVGHNYLEIVSALYLAAVLKLIVACEILTLKYSHYSFPS
jgi:hypothetical protein